MIVQIAFVLYTENDNQSEVMEKITEISTNCNKT
jgi:hypothetical protein